MGKHGRSKDTRLDRGGPSADLSQAKTGGHSRRRTVFRLLSYVKIHWPYAVGVTVAITSGAALNLAQPWIIGFVFFNSVLGGGNLSQANLGLLPFVIFLLGLTFGHDRGLHCEESRGICWAVQPGVRGLLRDSDREEFPAGGPQGDGIARPIPVDDEGEGAACTVVRHLWLLCRSPRFARHLGGNLVRRPGSGLERPEAWSARRFPGGNGQDVQASSPTEQGEPQASEGTCRRRPGIRTRRPRPRGLRDSRQPHSANDRRANRVRKGIVRLSAGQKRPQGLILVDPSGRDSCHRRIERGWEVHRCEPPHEVL